MEHEASMVSFRNPQNMSIFEMYKPSTEVGMPSIKFPHEKLKLWSAHGKKCVPSKFRQGIPDIRGAVNFLFL